MPFSLHRAFRLVAKGTRDDPVASRSIVPGADFLGVFVGALAGAIGAIRDRQHKYDVIGVIGLSFAAALGGGITRDVILQRGPPLAFLDIRYEIIAVGGALIALGFRSKLGARADRAIVIISRTLSSVMGAAACFALRLLSVSRDWKTRAVSEPF